MIVYGRLFTAIATVAAVTGAAAAAEFDPYEMNGGLVAAVAGRDFVVVATDTRMSSPSYQILERCHISSRLWTVSTDNNDGILGHGGTAAQAGDNSGRGELPEVKAYIAPDGSLVVPSLNDDDVDVTSVDSSSSSLVGLRLLQTTRTRTMMAGGSGVVWIASAGCQADCEGLKRRFRSKLRAATAFLGGGGMGPQQRSATTTTTPSSSSFHPASVALALHHELYSRRGFPYYAFCLVAGLTGSTTSRRSGTTTTTTTANMDDAAIAGTGTGGVYVYDAIGSYEPVAVASAGTGREYLQPILDRLFVSTNHHHHNNCRGDNHNSTSSGGGGGTGGTIDDSFDDNEVDDSVPKNHQPQQQQQQQPQPSPHPMIVTCCTTPDQAVAKLVQAYRAVAEREIAVGDGVILVSTQHSSDGTCETKIWSSPLKRH